MDLRILVNAQGKCAMLIKHRTAKKIFLIKQHTKQSLTREGHVTHIIPAVSCDSKSGNGDREGQSDETFTTMLF